MFIVLWPITAKIIICEPQSQSKLFRHFAFSLPSQCWCARFGQLTVIKKHWEDQENGPEAKKTALGVCELFLSETVLEKELNLQSQNYKLINILACSLISHAWLAFFLQHNNIREIFLVLIIFPVWQLILCLYMWMCDGQTLLVFFCNSAIWLVDVLLAVYGLIEYRPRELQNYMRTFLVCKSAILHEK